MALTIDRGDRARLAERFYGAARAATARS
ncbi:isopropylmalate isomerase [Rhodobacteraceae bacterium CCMM004]|nr:isopropylmalate isomerase [Rhodobacteraceae bacterium CCMM004]